MTNASTLRARTASGLSFELVQEFAHDRIKFGTLVEAVEANAETPPPSPNVNAASVQFVYHPLPKIAVDADARAVSPGIARRG